MLRQDDGVDTCAELGAEIDALIDVDLATLADTHGVSDSLRRYLCSHLVKQQPRPAFGN